jgi:alanine racemase
LAEHRTGVDAELAGARLTVDLDALGRNYRTLAGRAGGAAVAGVVKADAYGLGVELVARRLVREGCRSFFVAMPAEGIALRAVVPDSEIFVLSGLFGPASIAACVEARLTPVLASEGDLALWRGAGLPFGLHFDTGMNRQGFSPADTGALVDATGDARPALVMSHLACADDPAHPMNLAQLGRFREVATAFAGARRSLANSAGTFLGPDFAFDLVRPGIALYGGAPVNGRANPMQAGAQAEARIVQLRTVPAGETVSYGATVTLSRETRVAVAAIGYADGFHRASSGSGVPLREAVGQGAAGFLHGRRVPVLGRVTMDLTMFDVTDADGVAVGDWVELFGPNLALDDAARAAGTISYEMLTSIGGRYARRYGGGAL